jgi:hypothetical protein
MARKLSIWSKEAGIMEGESASSRLQDGGKRNEVRIQETECPSTRQAIQLCTDTVQIQDTGELCGAHACVGFVGGRVCPALPT